MAIANSLSLLIPLLLCFTSTLATLPMDPFYDLAACGVCPTMAMIPPYPAISPFYTPRWSSPYIYNPIAAISPYHSAAQAMVLNAPLLNQLQSGQLFGQLQSNQFLNQQHANQLFQQQQAHQVFNQLGANQLFNQLQSNQVFNQQQGNQMMMNAQMANYLMYPALSGGCCPGIY